MQTVTGYPTDLSSVEPSVVVTHNGVVRSVESVSVDRELPSNLPAAVSGGSGITAATGSIVWAEGELSESHAVHPWDGGAFPPATFDLVTVDTGYNGANARKFTGVVDGSAGTIQPGSSTVVSDIVDPIDRLNIPVTIEPLLASMPPVGDVLGEYTYRHIGLTATYFTDRLCRAAGFNSTPERGSNCVMSATLMGSSWPEAGVLFRSSDPDFAGSPSWFDAPWGQGAFSLDAAYWPFLTAVNGRLDKTMQITVMVGPDTHGPDPATVSVNWDATNYIRFRVMNNRAVYAQVMVGGTFIDVCSMAASTVSTATTFTLRVNAGGGVSLYADNGATSAGTFTPSAVMTGSALTDVSVLVPRASSYVIGGVQVAFNSVSTYQYTRNAFLTRAAYWQQMEASPYMENRMALDILREQSEAECAAMWIDEAGNFRWVNRDILTTGTPTETIEPLDDIESVGWEHNWASVRHRVDVLSKQPGISISPTYGKTAWQGSNIELRAGESHTEWVSAPAGVDWITVDETMRAITEDGASSLFNRGYGTFIGVTAVYTDGTTVGDEYNTGQYTWSFEPITPQTYKFTITMSAALSSDLNELRTPGDGFTTAFWPGRRAFNLPVVRCKAINEWRDVRTSGFHLGPVGAPVLQHDAGWWVQDLEELQRVADWLSNQLATPSPFIRDLRVIPDDRRQLGDIVTVQFENVTLRALIVGISDTTSTGGKAQSLTIRVLTVTTGTTYRVFDEAYGSYTYNQVDAAWGAETYNTLDSDPLRKA